MIATIVRDGVYTVVLETICIALKEDGLDILLDGTNN